MPHVHDDTDAAAVVVAGVAPRFRLASSPAVFTLRSLHNATAAVVMSIIARDPVVALNAGSSSDGVIPQDASTSVHVATTPAVFRITGDPAYLPYRRAGLSLSLGL
jgi:hypothetical protein